MASLQLTHCSKTPGKIACKTIRKIAWSMYGIQRHYVNSDKLKYLISWACDVNYGLHDSIKCILAYLIFDYMRKRRKCRTAPFCRCQGRCSRVDWDARGWCRLECAARVAPVHVSPCRASDPGAACAPTACSFQRSSDLWSRWYPAPCQTRRQYYTNTPVHVMN